MLESILIVIVVLFLFAAFPFWKRDFKVVFLPSHRKNLERIREYLELGKDNVVYDLGSGAGGALRILTQGTGARGVGIEISPLWHAVARWRYRNVPELSFRFGSIHSADISNATVAYCFLLPAVVARLASKLKQELQPGTRVVSYAFSIPGLEKIATIKNKDGIDCAFVYRI